MSQEVTMTLITMGKIFGINGILSSHYDVTKTIKSFSKCEIYET